MYGNSKQQQIHVYLKYKQWHNYTFILTVNSTNKDRCVLYVKNENKYPCINFNCIILIRKNRTHSTVMLGLLYDKTLQNYARLQITLNRVFYGQNITQIISQNIIISLINSWIKNVI